MEPLGKPITVRLPKELETKLRRIARASGSGLSTTIKMTLLEVHPMKETE